MPRLIGAVLIVFASCTVGISASALYKIRLRQLEAFHELITHIESQISGFLAPLDMIFEGYENKVLEACGFLERLRAEGGEAALEGCRGRLYLAQGELSELKRYFAALGRGAASDEAKLCRYYESRILASVERVRSELSGKVRLCQALGLLFGIMLAVILM